MIRRGFMVSYKDLPREDCGVDESYGKSWFITGIWVIVLESAIALGIMAAIHLWRVL